MMNGFYSRFALASSVAFLALALAAPAWSQAGKLVGRSPDRAITVRLASDSACADKVDLSIEAAERAFFTGAKPGVDGLLAGARVTVGSSCPAMGRISAKGRVSGQDKVIYTATLERATNWVARISAAGGKGVTGGTTYASKVGDQDLRALISDPGLIPANQWLQRVQSQYICSDPENGTCSALSQYTGFRGTAGSQSGAFVADTGGGTARTQNRATIDNNLFCIDPPLTEVTVEGGEYSSEARKDVADNLIDQIGQRTKSCIGFVNRDGVIKSITVDPTGEYQKIENTITLSATEPKLRLDRE